MRSWRRRPIDWLVAQIKNDVRSDMLASANGHWQTTRRPAAMPPPACRAARRARPTVRRCSGNVKLPAPRVKNIGFAQTIDLLEVRAGIEPAYADLQSQSRGIM